ATRVPCSNGRRPPLLEWPVGRTAAPIPLLPVRGEAERGRGGKSGLHGHAVPDNVRRGRPQGNCQRKYTAAGPPCPGPAPTLPGLRGGAGRGGAEGGSARRVQV